MARVGKSRRDWHPRDLYSGQGPQPPDRQQPKEAGWRQPAQQKRWAAWFGDNLAGQKKRLFCTSKIEQGESVGLPDFNFDVVTVVNAEGWAGDLFVLGPGHQQHPKETPSRGKGSPGSR